MPIQTEGDHKRRGELSFSVICLLLTRIPAEAEKYTRHGYRRGAFKADA